ncbi:MAG: hypothetical protein R3E83_25355 [Burkholderiaceae bacterium]
MTLDAAARVSGRLAGMSLAVMILCVVFAGLIDGFPRWLAGVAAWLAALALVRRMSRAQIWQVGVLVGVGLLGVAYSLWHGEQPPWPRLLDANAGLLTMIAAVSFLRMVALPRSDGERAAPRGPGAFRQTMFGVALFGAFINISAPILIGEQLARDRPLRPFEARSLTRVFSGCPAWSPFFGGMAVVLTLVHGMHLPMVMAVGLPFALIGYLVVLAEAHWRNSEDLAQFEGYPISVEALRVPAVLAIVVSLGYLFLSSVSVLVVISVCALLVTVIVLWITEGPRMARRRLVEHIQFGLPSMSGELFLFLAAGVLAVGLRAAVSAAHFSLPVDAFGAPQACGLLLAMIVISALGAHPVIFIVVITPLVLPLNPDPELLAVTYLFGWSLGTCASPLSGTHLIFQGRFGIPSLRGAMRNWPFVAVMAGVGMGFLVLIDHLAR